MNSYDTYKSLFRLIHQLGIPTSTKGSDFPLFYEDFIYLFLERGEGKEKEGRETSVCGCFSCTPSWGPGLQPGHMP